MRGALSTLVPDLDREGRAGQSLRANVVHVVRRVHSLQIWTGRERWTVIEGKLDVLSTLVSGLDRKAKQDSHWGKLDVLSTLVSGLCTVRKRWAVIAWCAEYTRSRSGLEGRGGQSLRVNLVWVVC